MNECVKCFKVCSTMYRGEYMCPTCFSDTMQSAAIKGLIKLHLTTDKEEVEEILKYIQLFDDWGNMNYRELIALIGDLRKSSCGDWNDSTSMIENKQGKYGSYICLSCAEDL